VATVLGIQTGLLLWINATVLGLAALLRASEVAYTMLRVVGAGYLLWLGVQSLRARSARLDAPGRGHSPLAGTGYWAGLLTNVLNPKVGVFFVTFLPAFVPPGAAVVPTLLLFGAVFIVLNLAYQFPLVFLADRVSRLVSRPRVRRAMDILTGTVLVGFGIRLATE
jgi:threonine/homoserine/homoserine lactone efflux protein